MEKKSVIIADDHPIFRSGLRALIEEDPAFSVVAEASDGDSAVRLIQEFRPAIVILDYNMPKRNGFEVLSEIAKLECEVIPVMLTMHNEDAMFAKSFELGVRGYVLKDSASAEIVACLHAVLQGQIYTSAPVTTYLFERTSRAVKAVDGIDSLTNTERTVLRLIAEYKTSREIAGVLSISLRTVENHRANICGKVGARGSHGLVKFALQHLSEI
jgi:DNA-binding NarL/FixJ family response regulator